MFTKDELTAIGVMISDAKEARPTTNKRAIELVEQALDRSWNSVRDTMGVGVSYSSVDEYLRSNGMEDLADSVKAELKDSEVQDCAWVIAQQRKRILNLDSYVYNTWQERNGDQH